MNTGTLDYFQLNPENTTEALCYLTFISGSDTYNFLKCHHHKTITEYQHYTGHRIERCFDCNKIIKKWQKNNARKD